MRPELRIQLDENIHRLYDKIKFVYMVSNIKGIKESGEIIYDERSLELVEQIKLQLSDYIKKEYPELIKTTT